MKNSIFRNLVVIVFVSSLLNACSLFNSNGDIKKLTETFFVGEAGTQYFIKPLEFESENGDEMYMDATFRYKDEFKDSAVVNFTIITEILIKKLNSVIISNDKMKYKTVDFDLLFAEKYEDDFRSRFSIKVPMTEFNKLIMNQNWMFTIDYSNGNLVYYSTSNTNTALEVINDDLFYLLR